MNPLELIKTIADFGFIVVAAGFVMWQVYNLVNNQNTREKNKIKKEAKIAALEEERENLKTERYETMLNDMYSKQDAFYDLLMENQKKSEERYNKMLDEILDILKSPHVLSTEENNRMTKIDEQIDLILERALTLTGGSRAALVKFHNGGNDMLGNSILKMSMSNEKCAAGVIHVMSNFQNQLRSFSTLLMKELNEKGMCFIEDVESIAQIDSSLYQYMKQTGIKAKYTIAVTNLKTDVVIGYILIDFANNNDIDIESVKTCLTEKKYKIESLLNL